MQNINTDIIIIGAGIAGLWLHHRLNDLGYHAVLLEKESIGNGQTLSSQGIIHGGIKYTLSGMLTNAASAIADMPKRWLGCIDGSGEIDLSNTRILSNHQLMWSTQSLSSKLTSFFSSKAVNGKMSSIARNAYPEFFQHAQFKGNLYQLNEPVLDVHSLIDNLSKKWRHRILSIEGDYTLARNSSGVLDQIIVYDKTNTPISINTQECLLTAGEGNEDLLKQLGINTPQMQRRPLHMVLAKGGQLPYIYAHCVGASTKPIATISSHSHSDGDTVWYIGGGIAEESINKTSEALIQHTISTFNKILPWVNTDTLAWSTHRVNRAEPAQKSGQRPDTAFLHSTHNVHTAWPTKLALTPNLSDQVIATLTERETPKADVTTQTTNDDILRKIAAAHLSANLWERSFDAKK